MDKIKNQLAGVAALLGVIAAIGGGFVKYGEVMTKLDKQTEDPFKLPEASEQVTLESTFNGGRTWRLQLLSSSCLNVADIISLNIKNKQASFLYSLYCT